MDGSQRGELNKRVQPWVLDYHNILLSSELANLTNICLPQNLHKAFLNLCVILWSVKHIRW